MTVIGVTGHRFLIEVDQLYAGIDHALERIARVYPGQSWKLVSCLAEGADCLVVERGLIRQPAAHLTTVLPLEVEDYLVDFSGPDARRKFQRLLNLAAAVEKIPPQSSRATAYQAAGLRMLEQIDVLIALWDGQPAQGPGGTGEMVERARKTGLPLAWVRCYNFRPGTNLPARTENWQGTVMFEGL